MNKNNLHRCLVLLVLLDLVMACVIPGVQPTPPLMLPSPNVETPPQLPSSALESPPAQPFSQVSFYLVALEDNGKSGIPIGCGDSLVAITRQVEPTTDPVTAALEQLFLQKTQFLSESGLYTSLYQSDLKVQSIVYGPGGDVWVELTGTYLLGGVCDNPRFQGQIEQTIRATSHVSAVNVTINGKPLHEIVSNR